MYTDILRRFKDAVRRKRPEKMESKQLASTSRQCSSTPVGFGRGFLDKGQCDNMEYPKQALNLAPANFCLFPRLKSALKGRRFCDAMALLRMRRKS